jgi:hypothetical protein
MKTKKDNLNRPGSNKLNEKQFRPPKFSQADPKLDVQSRLPKKIGIKKWKFFEIIFFDFFLKFSMKTRSVAEHSVSND